MSAVNRLYPVTQRAYLYQVRAVKGASFSVSDPPDQNGISGCFYNAHDQKNTITTRFNVVSITNKRTDQPTDGRTNMPLYRDERIDLNNVKTSQYQRLRRGKITGGTILHVFRDIVVVRSLLQPKSGTSSYMHNPLKN